MFFSCSFDSGDNLHNANRLLLCEQCNKIHKKSNCIYFDAINVVMYLFLCNICISYLSVLNMINSVPANVYNVHVYAN